MKWASAISTRDDIQAAVDDAVESTAEQLGGHRPDLVIAFVTPHYRSDWDSLPALLAGRFPGAVRIGCSAGGAIGAGTEIENSAAIALAAGSLPEVRAEPFHIAPGDEPDPVAAAEFWRQRLRLGRHEHCHTILLPEPFSCSVEELITGLDTAFANATNIGGLASGGRRAGENLLLLQKGMVSRGCVGVALIGDVGIDSVVAQGCRPIGNPMFVTGCRGPLVLELDGSRPTDVLQELFDSLSEYDQELLRQALFAGIVMRDDQTEYGPGDFLIRNILGFDPNSGALAIGSALEPGQVIQFHLRDRRTSAQDLQRCLAAYSAPEGEQLAGALLFSCLGRGEQLYEVPNHDSGAFHDRFGPVPLAGFFCSGEIGPVHQRTFLHGYTSAFALFRQSQGH